MRAALYARVSTDKQKDEQTIDTQINEVRDAIESDNNTLLDENIYTDAGWSGAYIERPSLDLLRQDARSNKFDIVYVYDKGRLSRIYVHQEVIIGELKNLNIAFKSLHDINGQSPEEQVMGGVMGLFHEYERIKTAERFRIAKLNKVRNGNLLGYNPPYGYSYVPVQGKGLAKENGRFEVNSTEAEVVKKVFHWVGIEGISLREVIRKLHTEGIPPRKAHRAAWTKGPIVRMLRNETYIGKHHYNKSESCLPKNPVKDRKHFQHTNKTSRRPRERSEWLMVEVPAIINPTLFDKAQEQLNLNMKYAKRNSKHEYLFGGLTYCTCGHKRTGEGARGHYYYRCTERLHTFPEPSQCSERGINVEVMDSTAWDKLVILLTEPSLIEQQLERYLEKRNQSSQNVSDVQRLEKELLSLTAEESRYVGAYGRGSINEDVFDKHMSDVNKRKAKLIRQLDITKSSTPDVLPDINANNIQQRFTHLLDELDYNDKLFTVRKIVDKVIATKEEITICGSIPLTPQPPEKAELHAKYRHSRSSQCREIDAF